MTMADGRILYGSTTDGALRSVPFAGGRVVGGPTTLSTDGTWRYRTFFAGEGAGEVNRPPTASAAGSCDGLTCSFTGGGEDPDGGPVTLAWDARGRFVGLRDGPHPHLRHPGDLSGHPDGHRRRGRRGDVDGGRRCRKPGQTTEITSVGVSSVNRNALSFPVTVPARHAAR